MKRLALSLLLLFALALAVATSTAPRRARADFYSPYSIGHRPTVFANLGAPNNGQARYCSDCQATSPCTSGGTGAIATRIGGAWNCSTGTAGATPPTDDGTAIVKGSADATKLLRFEVDGFTAGTTRVLTPPNFDGTIATLAGTETFTNKALALGSNTVSGTLAQFNTAVTDADLASLAGAETLTNKTLTSPVLTTPNIGAATGTSVALGTNPATSGIIALPNNQSIVFRNAANNNNVTALMVNSSNIVAVGSSSSNITLADLWTVDAGTGGIRTAGTYPIQWTNQGVAIAGVASGAAEINNGTNGTQRDLRVRGLQHFTGTRPTCDSTNRGMTWYVAGGAGVADAYEICRKDSSDAYAWVTLF